MWEWIAAKGQVDFGNLAVGIATALVALITLYVSIVNIRGIRNQKLAEFRNSWLGDLRDHFARFSGSCLELLLASDKTDSRVLERLFHATMYIRLKLKSNERTKRLSNLMHDMQALALKEKQEDFQRLLSEYLSVSESILQDAWDDINKDLKYNSKRQKKGNP